MATTTLPSIWTGPFRRVFAAAFASEVAWALTLHLPRFFADSGASESMIGVTYSLAALAGLLARPLVGRLLDLRGRKPILITAALAETVLLLLYVLIQGFGPPVVMLRILQGTGQVILFTALFTYAADAIPEGRRARGLAIFGLTGLIPIAAGGLLGDIVIGLAGFRGLFIGASLLSATGAALMFALPVLSSGASPDAPRRSLWAAAMQRDLLPVWALGLSFTVGLETLFTFSATFSESASVGAPGLYFAVHGATAVLIRLAGRGLAERFGTRRVVTPSILSMAVALSLLATAATTTQFVAAAALAGAGHGLAFPILSALVVDRARAAERGSAMAVFTSLFDVALLVGMPVVGAIIDTVGYPTAFTFSAVVVVIGLLTFLRADRRVGVG